MSQRPLSHSTVVLLSPSICTRIRIGRDATTSGAVSTAIGPVLHASAVQEAQHPSKPALTNSSRRSAQTVWATSSRHLGLAAER
eukprot:988846-Pyramimonas_sp.AAC.1